MTGPVSSPTEPTVAQRREAAAVLGDAMRELSRAVVETEVPSRTLHSVADVLHSLTEQLDERRRPAWTLPSIDDLASNVRSFSPTRGLAHPGSPPVTFETVPGRCSARATFDRRFEGPPEHLHGGMISLTFDEVLGMVPISLHRWGMTAFLNVSYLAPVPLHVPVEFHAWVAEESGRKTLVHGTLATSTEPDTILARAEALFIAPTAEHQNRHFAGLQATDGTRSTTVFGKHAGLD